MLADEIRIRTVTGNYMNIESSPKMGRLKVLCLSIWYPLTMSRYFEKALRHRDDVELLTCGPYTGSWIPWLGGMSLPEKYAVAPDIPLSVSPNIGQVNYDMVKAMLPQGWVPDVVLCIDAGISWKYKPMEGQVVHIATDPHVLNYDHQRSISDYFFNMQKVYSQGNDIWLPYAYSKYDFYPVDGATFGGLGLSTDSEPVTVYNHHTIEKDTDAVLIGMPYAERVEWVNKLRARGVSVIFENGPVYDEARRAYARGRIGLNWSSMDDLNCRAFEIPAMKMCPVMNPVSDMAYFLEPEFDYVPFVGMNDAVEKVIWAKENPKDAEKIAENAYQKIQGETYDARVDQLLEVCGWTA